MATIDAFSYAGEADILELRLKMLDSVVDAFVIVEANYTFSGHEKPLHYELQKERFAPWAHKIKYYVVDNEFSPEEVEQARVSPHTGGHFRWMLEFLQKEAIHKALTHLDDEDIVYVGDVDELWKHREPNGVEKLKLRVYTYFINLHSTEEFWGPIRAKYRDIKGQCLNDLRNNKDYRTEDYQGWHFTNQGGLEAVKQKIVDQYNADFFAIAPIQDNLEQRFGKQDYIGRDFVLTEDESEWPQFLRENREQFTHLCTKAK